MNYLLLAMLALALGPILLHRFRERPALSEALDGFVLVAITGLIFLHFLSPAMEHKDLAVVACLVVGFLCPVLLERMVRSSHDKVDLWGLFLGLTGLAVHAGLDGAALATLAISDTDAPLAVAVILHRLPVGIAVWWLATRLAGRRAAVSALLALMGATAVGYQFGAEVTHDHDAPGLVNLYQALVGGALVHVAVHPHHGRGRGHSARAEGWGALGGLLVLAGVALIPGADAHDPDPFLARLFALSAASAPALLLAYLFAGLLSAFIPSASIRWLRKGRPLGQAGRGMLIGLPFPVCSCGVVPLYRTLVAKGAPPAAAMAFLVATPELGVDAVLLSIPLLGPDVTLLRLATAAAAALLVGWWVGGRLQAKPPATEQRIEASAGGALGTRLRAALVTGTGEVVDHTAPWIILGLTAAALVAPWLEGGWLTELPAPWTIILFAALGFPMYVCAASATPLVAALLAAGLSPGAGIAFLITGPATNLSTLGVLSSLHGRRAAVAFAATLTTFAVATGITVDAVFTSLDTPALGDLTEQPPSTLQLFALAGLVLLFGASIARRGMRRFAAEIGAGLGWNHDHDHAHA